MIDENHRQSAATLPPSEGTSGGFVFQAPPGSETVFTPTLGTLVDNHVLRVVLRDTEPAVEETEKFSVSWSQRWREDYGYLRVQVTRRSRLETVLRHIGLSIPKGGTLALHKVIEALARLEAIPAGVEVHHVNFNPLSNHPDNLQRLSREEHRALHRYRPRAGAAPDPGPLYLHVWHRDLVSLVRQTWNHGLQGRSRSYGDRHQELDREVDETIARVSRGETTPGEVDPVNPMNLLSNETCGDYPPHTDGQGITLPVEPARMFDVGSVFRTPQIRELRRFGLVGKAAMRAVTIVRYLNDQGGFGAMAEIEAAVSDNPVSRRTLERTVRALVEAGLLASVKRGRYTLTNKARIRL